MFKVPQKTSVLKNHTHSPVGIISFAPELIKFIKEKKKYQTYRFADEKYQQIKVGDIVSIREYGGAIIGPAKITKKVSTTPRNAQRQRASEKSFQWLLCFSGAGNPG